MNVYFLFKYIMKNIFYISAIISIVYFLLKFIEIKYISNEECSIKIILRETLFVYFSVISGLFINSQFQNNSQSKDTINVFLDQPEF